MLVKLSFYVLFSLLLLKIGFAQNPVVVQTEVWCVAKNDAEDPALLTALNWACGPGNASCSPIQQGGPCYDPTDIQGMASFVFNDYYLKHGMTDDACFFDNNAALSSLNPSHGNCKLPSSKAMGGGVMAADSTPKSDSSSSIRIFSVWFWPSIFIPLFII